MCSLYYKGLFILTLVIGLICNSIFYVSLVVIVLFIERASNGPKVTGLWSRGPSLPMLQCCSFFFRVIGSTPVVFPRPPLGNIGSLTPLVASHLPPYGPNPTTVAAASPWFSSSPYLTLPLPQNLLLLYFSTPLLLSSSSTTPLSSVVTWLCTRLLS